MKAQASITDIIPVTRPSLLKKTVHLQFTVSRPDIPADVLYL